MQTFVPFPDVAETMAVLDNQRLGKQRVETYQIILGVLRIQPDGSPKLTKRTWGDHILGKMWADNLGGLWVYHQANVKEWTSKRTAKGVPFKDTTLASVRLALERGGVDLSDTSMPWWWGDEAIHASHRAALLFKAPEFYAQYGWTETPAYAYVWPKKDETIGVTSER